jgi:hypothetical protein
MRPCFTGIRQQLRRGFASPTAQVLGNFEQRLQFDTRATGLTDEIGGIRDC